MCSVDMSHGLMSCSMDRSKMQVQRRHSCEKMCVPSLLESTTVFSTRTTVCASVPSPVCASVYLCVSVCRVYVYVCLYVHVRVCLCVSCVYL